MCSLSSPLWSFDAGRSVALCLLASMLSGDECIVNMRSEILKATVGPGWSCKSRVIPTVSHPIDVTKSRLHGACVIYVGHPRGMLQCTPWVNPCSMIAIRSPDGDVLDFEKYCNMRADIDEWLSPLLGCHLICSCCLPGLKCHARYIQTMCVEMVEPTSPEAWWRWKQWW